MTPAGRACLTEAANALRHMAGDALFVAVMLGSLVVLEAYDRWERAKAWLGAALDDEEDAGGVAP